MTKIRSITLLICAPCVLAGCDPNSKPEYGSDTGLPKNCRAYVQVAVNDYKAKRYTADEVMEGLERNCGEHGITWSSQ